MSGQHSYAVFGAAGCGRGVLPLVRQQLQATQAQPFELVFVDDAPPAEVVNGHRVLTYAQWLAEPAASRHMNIAIANSAVRQKLAERCVADGVLFFEARAANVVQLDEVCHWPRCHFVPLCHADQQHTYRPALSRQPVQLCGA
jgi:hypothetical protein